MNENFQNTYFKHHNLRIVTQNPIIKYHYQTSLFFPPKLLFKHRYTKQALGCQKLSFIFLEFLFYILCLRNK